ncbi:MAG: hypothetical protein ABFS16_16110, partial [Bacteroidota bacterium]
CNPRQLGAWLLKASAQNTQKKYNEALKASNEMLKIKEAFADGHYQKGFALKHLNKPNEAIKEFQLATAHKKEYYQAFMQIGEILTNYKNYKKALDVYNQVFKFKPNDVFATIYSAKCHHLLNDNKKAEELINSVPRKNQNNLETVKVKCRIAMGKGNTTQAAQYLNMARNINNNSELFVLRAKYVLTKNNRQLAKQYLDKANELDNTNREAQDLLKVIQPKNTSPKKAQQPEKPKQQQSIMFQKPKQKQTSPIKVPVK